MGEDFSSKSRKLTIVLCILVFFGACLSILFVMYQRHEIENKVSSGGSSMSFFGKPQKAKGWDCFPEQFVKGVRETLGTQKFESLTLLAEKYGLFDQDLFAHPKSFTDVHDELTKMEIAALLTSMGNELARHHIVEDAEEVLRIALILRPEHAAARGTLASICYSTGRFTEAKEHALRAIADMDSHAERYKDVPVPEHIADSNAIDSFRLVLQSIAESEKSD